MKKLLLILFSISLSTNLFAQYKVTIEAYVLDKTTNQPIPYVNIGFIEKSIGTVTDKSGKFTLIYDEDIIGGKDFVQFSTLGYKTLKVRVSQLVKFLTNTNKFYLTPEPLALDEVFISNVKRSQIRIGNPEISPDVMGYWKDKEALGGEITTRIKIKNKATKLLDLKFNIIENTSDSIKIRVNVYKYKKNYPKQNILKANIFHIIKIKKGEETINLQPYNIMVNDDVVIGIELVKVYGANINFAVSASNTRGISFLRLFSQDKWRRFSNVGMNFSVLTSFPTNKSNQVLVQRENPKKITLYYDISKQMKNRLYSKEFDLLSSYLKTLKEVEVEVIKFNNNPKKAKAFNISRGKSDELISYLKDSNYDGASNFKDILKSNPFEADVILLFSNGKSNFYPLEQGINKPTFSINSLENANHFLLQKTAFYEDGHYINLKITSEKLALEFMQNEVDDKMIYKNDAKDIIVYKGAINGKVFTASRPIQGASIRVQNTYIEAQTDVDGFFDIEAKKNDILVINSLGMVEEKIKISNIKNIQVLMKPDGELLDEVEIEGTKKNTDEIETAYGKKNKDAIGYAVDTITEEEIMPENIYLGDVIRGKFSGVTVRGFGDNVSYTIRGGNSSFSLIVSPIFDVDGNIFTSPPTFIMPQQIESITVLKSLAATNKYGSEGRGGVFVIKMKRATWDENDNKKVGSARVKGNDYIENLPLINSNQQIPTYLAKLQNAKTFKEALEVYYTQKPKIPQLSIPYLLDVSDYFMKWDKNKAFTILSNIASIAYSNPKALKTLAYKLEELDKLEDAKQIYKRIAVIRPNDSQSYRDLALIYESTGNYEQAMDLYEKMLNNLIEGTNFKGLYHIIASELQRLIALHRNKIDYSKVHADYLRADFKYDRRIVFDWNDPNTEFEIQFVNPKKKYYTWSHTRFENKDRMIDEINYGYNTEEYIIDNANSGEWIINIKSISKEDLLNPTFLKYTVFKNYGLSNESKEVKVIKLYQQKQKVTLDRFLYK